jgi:cysteine desulfurase/selenocysteine lyase
MSTAAKPLAGYDLAVVRRDFPILASRVHGKPLVYLDNAATTQKPQAVIDAVMNYYTFQNSNIHRGVHHLSEVATRAYETARVKIQRFLNAADAREIVFTRGATESINLVAQSFVRPGLQAGDEVLITHLEHHSNIVPWQMLRDEKGLVLKVAPIDDRGELILEEFEKLITPRTKLISVAHVSNALGTVLPVRKLVAMARARGVAVMLDGAQAVPHLGIDVRDLDCDFYAFSGHKLYGPTGIGVLYGKAARLEAMPPYQGGGDMILSVTFEKTKYNQLPYKFEAGTPHIEGVVGLGAAIDYLQKIGMGAIAAHEDELLRHGTRVLTEIPGLRLIGTAREKAGVLSFDLEGVHPHDIGTILDQEGIAIRTGHHCAQPVMDRFNVPATARASLALYNSWAEMETLAAGLRKVAEVFRS